MEAAGPLPHSPVLPEGRPGHHDPAPRAHRTGAPVALITGASSGIGAAVASRFAAEGGWQLLLNGRDEERLDRIADRCGATALPCDLADPAGCGELVDRALDVASGVDVLVAGAGIGWAGPFTAMPPAAIDEVLAVDLAAVLHLTRRVLPDIVRRDRGHLLFVGSIAGAVGVREEAAYSAAKAAVAAFAESLRYELAGSRVRVSLVVPGAVNTPFFTRRGAPYQRSRPRPIAAARVADAVWDAVEHERSEVFVPGWLQLPARFKGLAPALFRRLATRFA
ncbi:SDR family NAD(P)-dependent oxidoreductase [Streptomyces sp. NPDC050315]|uniref:SDR family NAD(P)-dependent oxidoreductase n=1 Tax=Streptomyces sp. NPDC050315 TaxID=3155039 RepID=UPI003421C312